MFDEDKFNKEDELHLLAREILENLDEVDNAERREFSRKLLNSYQTNSDEFHYNQDWAAYNAAQMREKIALMSILDELLCYIQMPTKQGPGRKPISLRDRIFYVVLQAYNGKSSRRSISDLTLAKNSGFISTAPHFNTLLKCLGDTQLTQHLERLIALSSLPLRGIEKDFAVDSSGFSTSQFGRWFDVRLGSNSEKRHFMKAHVTCGVRTNVITAVNVTRGFDSDTSQFQDLVEQTKRLHDIREVSADKAYSSRENLQTVWDVGGVPFIPFKSNVTERTKSLGSSIWKKMYLFFLKYEDEFMHHYHKRSNSETTFHMIKQKFGSHLRSKAQSGQINEILAKCLCHNLCVLVQEALELGINIDFEKCADYEVAHK